MAITGLEVFLAYKELQPKLMLTILIGLSLVKAAMIMSYFMHLKFEKIFAGPVAGPGDDLLHCHDDDFLLHRGVLGDGITASLRLEVV